MAFSTSIAKRPPGDRCLLKFCRHALMQDSISDVGAVAFATKFYGGIASGQSLRSSFEQGVIAIESVSLDETGTPALFTAGGVNAAKLKLV
jgi:hypothetical protein